jgi:hypothetical protein
MGRMSRFAKVVHSTIAMLRFPGITTSISHSSEQGTLPTASLISKQAIPYWTRGGTCCHRVTTPKIQSLADSSMTNYKL